jgi:hypothetical protein
MLGRRAVQLGAGWAWMLVVCGLTESLPILVILFLYHVKEFSRSQKRAKCAARAHGDFYHFLMGMDFKRLIEIEKFKIILNIDF